MTKSSIWKKSTRRSPRQPLIGVESAARVPGFGVFDFKGVPQQATPALTSNIQFVYNLTY